MIWQGHAIWHGRSGMIVLLVLLLIAVFVVPVLFAGDRFGQLLVDCTLTLVMLSGAVTLASSRPAAVALGSVALAALTIRWAPWALPGVSLPVLREATTLVSFALFAVFVGVKVFAPGRVTVNRVFAAVILYLLLGLCWAMVYELVAASHPDAFAGMDRESSGHTRWVYFSFVTLTTVGYGDITPVAATARSLAILEALVGQLYPVVLLGRLVSLEAQDVPGAQ